MNSTAGASCAVAGSSWATSGRRSSSVFSAAGKPVTDASISGCSCSSRFCRSGAMSSRSWSVGDSSRAAGPQLRDQRVGLVGELGQPLEGQRATPSRTSAAPGTTPCSSSSRAAVVANTVFVFSISERSWSPRSVERAEDDPGVGDQARDRALLAVEDRDDVRGVLGERREVAERVVEVAPAARDRLRLRLHPVLERGAGLGVERAQDLVELDRVRHLRGGQHAALGDRLGRAAARASARRRSRPAASSGAGSPCASDGSGA